MPQLEKDVKDLYCFYRLVLEKQKRICADVTSLTQYNNNDYDEKILMLVFILVPNMYYRQVLEVFLAMQKRSEKGYICCVPFSQELSVAICSTQYYSCCPARSFSRQGSLTLSYEATNLASKIQF